MTIRKILVPLVGAERDDGALAMAAVAAKELGAHVEGFFVRPDPNETLPFMGEGVAGPVIQDILSAAKDAADHAAARAKATVEKHAQASGFQMLDAPRGPGAPTMSFVQDMGPFAVVVGARALLCDLVVFENGHPNEGYGYADALQECLMARGRPILLSPQTKVSQIGTDATIGWDGSAEAAHAVRAAMPFLQKSRRIRIVNVTSGAKDTTLTDTLADYLAFFGLHSEEHVVDPEGRAIGEVLLGEAVKAGSDILVMGGYGHSRIRELLLGGATRHVLANAALPVLLAH